MKTPFLALPLLALAPSCAPPESPAPAPVAVDHGARGDHADHDDHEGDHVPIPPTLRDNLGLTFARVEPRHVAQTIRIPGAFELQPLARHEYRMSLPGRVELRVDQHERVEPGQILYRFQSPAWPELMHEIIAGEQGIETALAELEVGRAKLEQARRRLELVRGRVDALAQADFKRADLETEAAELEASLPPLEAELRLAETRLANARRTREHALHRASTAAGIPEEELEAVVTDGERRTPTYLTIDWIEVRAKEHGIVEALSVTDGAFVEPPATVLSTVDTKLVRFRALALQADLPHLVDTAEARIVPPQSPGFPIDAGVDAEVTLGLEAHPEERTLTVYATPRELVPWARSGVSAFLEVVTASSEGPALAVPRAAVVEDGNVHVFFLRDPDDPDVAVRVEADLGASDGRWVVLESGVRAGDEVVLQGAYELKLATADAPATGAHVHADGSVHEDH